MPPLKVLLALLAAGWWGCCQALGAVPPPPEQGTANCSNPTYASDQLVCADPDLLALDRRMVVLLAEASPAGPGSPLHWFEPQPDWFRRRSLCAFSERHAACLIAAYSERIDLLAALAGRASGQTRPAFLATCPGAPWGNGPVRLHQPDPSPLSIQDGRGRLLVLASALQPQDDWSPFVRIGNDARGIRLEPPGGSVVRCRALPVRLNP
ncbi:hypothetical protein [Synechococcus sp. J7-Johnson]|uniref:hypothetical protein n=1 Tax=Synechococcus sp. J7-Johnson TaxID=2823737 RepID=UPI0020CE9AB6|nr:hypothetical protein [Synechococcus sp. J7-Johnson]